jgi:hypothetical protein
MNTGIKFFLMVGLVCLAETVYSQTRIYSGNCRGTDNVVRQFKLRIEGARGSRKIATMGTSNKWVYLTILADDGKGYFKIKAQNGTVAELQASNESATTYVNGSAQCTYSRADNF